MHMAHTYKYGTHTDKKEYDSIFMTGPFTQYSQLCYNMVHYMSHNSHL